MMPRHMPAAPVPYGRNHRVNTIMSDAKERLRKSLVGFGDDEMQTIFGIAIDRMSDAYAEELLREKEMLDKNHLLLIEKIQRAGLR